MTFIRGFFSMAFFLSLSLVGTSVSAQDTTRYCQENGVLFSNCYEFIRANKSDNYGTFTQRTSSNEGQVFYGWGSFKESKSYIKLTYSKVNTYPMIKYKNAKVYSDTLCIQWFSRDNAQEFFRIKYQDENFEKIYKSNWQEAMVKIPKDELKDTKLELYQGGNKIMSFTVKSTRTDFILIYAEDPRALCLQKTKETLTKTRLGFTTKGVKTKEKKSNFLIIK